MSLLSQNLNQKEKIRIISEIDNLQVNKGNYFRLAELQKAVSIARQIIGLAEEGPFPTIVEDEKRFIAEIEGGYYSFERISQFKKAASELKYEFTILFEDENYNEAHALVEKFSTKYADYLATFSLPAVEYVLKKDQEISLKRSREGERLIEKLDEIELVFRALARNNERNKARESLDQAWSILFKINDRSLQEKWAKLENDFEDHKLPENGSLAEPVKDKSRENDDFYSELEESYEEITSFTEERRYEDALDTIDRTLELLMGLNLEDYEEKFIEKREQVIERKAREDELNKKLDELDYDLKGNLENERYENALKNCEDIIKLSKDQGREDLVEQYENLLKQIKDRIEKQKKQKKHLEKLLLEKAREVNEVLEIDEDTLPIIEEFSVEDMIGDLSEETSEMMEQVSSLLEDNRVEVKNEATNKAILVSVSGEVVENEHKMIIEEPEAQEKNTNYRLQSGFSNPFDDMIEEAIMSDIIPYNFEISEITLNGEKVKTLPDKTLTKEGLELQWQFSKIPPKETMAIDYNLRRRVSRTIIFILQGNVKIIKTHSNLRRLNLEGVYDALLPFTNSFGDIIKGLIMEDIIPLYYLHFIVSPENRIPSKVAEANNGNLIKWDIGNLEQETLSHHYKLLELYKYEEIKMEIQQVNKEAVEFLQQGNRARSRERFAYIQQLLSQYLS